MGVTTGDSGLLAPLDDLPGICALLGLLGVRTAQVGSGVAHVPALSKAPQGVCRISSPLGDLLLAVRVPGWLRGEHNSMHSQPEGRNISGVVRISWSVDPSLLAETNGPGSPFPNLLASSVLFSLSVPCCRSGMAP